MPTTRLRRPSQKSDPSFRSMPRREVDHDGIGRLSQRQAIEFAVEHGEWVVERRHEDAPSAFMTSARLHLVSTRAAPRRAVPADSSPATRRVAAR